MKPEVSKASRILVNILDDDDGSLTQDDLDLVDYFQEIYPVIQFTVFLGRAAKVTSIDPTAVTFHNEVPSKRDILDLLRPDEIN